MLSLMDALGAGFGSSRAVQSNPRRKMARLCCASRAETAPQGRPSAKCTKALTRFV